MQPMFEHTKTLARALLGVSLALLGSVGCSEDPKPSATPTLNAANSQPLPSPITADQIFATRCATCHGNDGKGNGPAARALNPKPRNYTDPAWQQSVTDETIRKAIIEGGPAVGKSALMAPNADLADKPVVLDELVKIVRGFGQHG